MSYRPFYLLLGSLTPVINGVYINDVTQGMPAQTAGLIDAKRCSCFH